MNAGEDGGDDVGLALAHAPPDSLPPGLLDRAMRDARARLFQRPAFPSEIGRFRVIEELGRGGMGTVYRVRDPQLRRTLALKSLLNVTDSDDLLGEARALAQVRHSNVATIFEAFEDEHGIHITMELVEGRSLRAWIRDEHPPFDARIRVLLEAGRGLAAVHDAGLVHRDVTPNNIMVDREGHARLVDFGLAVRATSASPAPSGTPGYIAPEVLAGAGATAASDQYAFAQVAFECLRAHESTRMPPAVAKSLRQSLEREPAERYESVSILVHALNRAACAGPERRRTLRLVGFGASASVAALSLALVGSTSVSQWRSQQQREACEDAADREAERFWSAGRRDDVRAALVDGSPPFATAAAASTIAAIDDYVEQWTTAHAAACDSAWPRDAVERSLWCTELAAVRTESLLAAFETGDPHVVAASADAVARLPAVSDCAHRTALERGPPPPGEDSRPAVLSAARSLAEVTSMQHLGRYAEAKVAAGKVVTRTESTPLSANARATLGQVLLTTGERNAAAAELEAAFFEAQAMQDPRVAATAALALADCRGVRDGAFDDGERWLRHASVAIASETGFSAERHRIEALMLGGAIADERGDLPTATVRLTDAVDAARAKTAPRSLLLAHALHDLGLVLVEANDLAGASAVLEESLEIAMFQLGDRHPNLATVVLTLARLHLEEGHLHAALAEIDRALDLERSAFGDEHEALVFGYNLRAVTLDRLGRHEEALQMRERSLGLMDADPDAAPIDRVVLRSNYTLSLMRLGRADDAVEQCRTLVTEAEAAFGEEHPQLGVIVNNCAKVHARAGDSRSSASAFSRALRIVSATPGNERATATIASNLGEELAKLGDYSASRRHLVSSVQTFEELFGPEHPEVAIAKTKLGGSLLAAGENDAARTAFEDAVAIFEHADGDYSSAKLARDGLRYLAPHLSPTSQ